MTVVGRVEGRSLRSRLRSPRVLALSAAAVRSPNSSASRRPATWCSASWAVTRSRSWSEARIPSEREPKKWMPGGGGPSERGKLANSEASAGLSVLPLRGQQPHVQEVRGDPVTQDSLPEAALLTESELLV